MKLPQPGDVIGGRYRVESKLGEGGFGAVYGATDTSADRKIALKVVKPDAGATYHPRSRARFQREIEMVARLRSPHAVKLFDYGETADGVLFMVFEFVEGEDLDELIRRVGHLAPAAATHVLRQLLEALAEAHAAGLLHRDLKPENVRVHELMGDPLRVKLLDFGLARATDGGHPSVTATGEFIGTPRYMAPEQLLQGELTPATDLYCLGLIGYELLLGADALSANSVGQQLERLQTGHVVSADAIDRIGPQLSSVLQRMTARAPADRFQSARAVLNALAASELPGNPSSEGRDATALPAARTHATTERGPLGRPRSWAPIAAAIVVAVLLAGSAIVLASRPTAAPPRTPDPQPIRVETLVRQPDPTPPIEPDVGAEPAVSSGCGNRPFEGIGFLEQPGLNLDAKRWLTYVPPGLDPAAPVPLVVLIHEQGQTARTYLERGGFKPIADREHFIIIAPEDSTHDPWEPSEAFVADMLDVISTAGSTLCIDSSRIFAVGHGNGAWLAERVACTGVAAGFATQSLSRNIGDDGCTPIRPVPQFLFYPTKSGYAPYKGGKSATGKIRESVHEVEQRWLIRNTCDKRPRKRRVGSSTCFDWKCETPFRSCHVDGGGNWPGLPERGRVFQMMNGDGPLPDPNFPIAELIWKFFASLPDSPMPAPPQ